MEIENMNQALERTREMLALVERSNAERIEKIEEAESAKEKALQAMKEYTKNGDIEKIKDCRLEADALEERIHYLTKEAPEASFQYLEEEIDELQALVKSFARQKAEESGEIYYNAWIEGERADLEAQQTINNANWIIRETDKILNRERYDSANGNLYGGMLEPSKRETRFIETWNRFYRRRREGY